VIQYLGKHAVNSSLPDDIVPAMLTLYAPNDSLVHNSISHLTGEAGQLRCIQLPTRPGEQPV
jgi:hypothetical protein